MLILLSPAKTLDFETPLPTSKHSQPALLDRAEPLVKAARKLSAKRLGDLMGISDTLAEENVRRFEAWSTPFTPENARPAVYAFRGDVYQGLDADTLTARDVEWAQKHLRILSGLYGVLRPLDLIQPYRLEMGLPLAVGKARNLYEYWGATIAETLMADLKALRSRLVVNLASQEYFKSVDLGVLDAEIVTPAFKEKRDGKLKMISFSAKRARGLLARYAIDERAAKAEDLRDFKAERYRYAARGSSDDAPLFTRSGKTAAVAKAR